MYLGKQKEDGKEYAVKAFSKEYILSQPKGRESMKNEINILLDLHHRNVIELIEVHESKNSLYVILEYLGGGSLSDYLKRSTEFLSDDTVLKIVKYRLFLHRGILSGVAYIASLGYIHRDIKPENIMLSHPTEVTSDSIKLCDFGLATHVDVKEYLYKRCGTPGYVSPEIVNADANDPNFRVNSKCDAFSVGVIMYLLMSRPESRSWNNAILRRELQRNSEEDL